MQYNTYSLLQTLVMNGDDLLLDIILKIIIIIIIASACGMDDGRAKNYRKALYISVNKFIRLESYCK